jgi:c-di-GMP-binding flagellar brake protein YcgR
MSGLRDFSGQERRRFNRIEDNLFVFYRAQRQKQPIEAITADIGAGGLMLRTDSSIRPQELLELEIYSPLDINKSLFMAMNAMARVAWSKRIKDSPAGSNRFAAGLEFSGITRQDRKRIMDYVTKRQRARLKRKRV